jgi:putative flavoprotein involved in K+ transport
MSRHVDTVVIGAGPAGLATSQSLSAAGHEHVVLERGRVAETWRSQRWDGFHMNTPNWMNRLPGAPDEAWPPGGFAGGHEFVAGLDRYASLLGLPVREGVAVESVRLDAGGYAVDTSDGRLHAANVVLACGAQTVPRLPALAEGFSAAVEQLHAADYRRPGDLLAGGVLVVGSGQSGGQIAEELLDAGRRVYLATSRVGRLPRRHRGRDTVEWWREMGWYEQRVEDVPAAVRRAHQPLVSGTDGGHTLSLQGLARKGAVLLGRLAGVVDDRAHFGDDLALNLAAGDLGAERIRRRVDAYIERVGAYAPAYEPDPAERPLRRVRHVPALDLGAEHISTVIWATGFRADFSWLQMPMLSASGLPFHTGVTLPAPGLYAVGMPWLTRRGSGMVYGMGRDAAHVAQRIVARSESRMAA